MIRIFKSHDRTDHATNRFSNSLTEAVSSTREIEYTQASFNAIAGLITSFAPLAVLLIGVLEIMHERLTVGGLIAFSANVLYLFGPIRELVSFNIGMNASLAAAKRVFQIYDLVEEARAFGGKSLSSIKHIQFNDTSCIFQKENLRGLKKVDFALNKGELLCIIGKTGTGKSTIGNLLFGFNMPTGGEIMVNAEPYQRFRLADIRRNIGYVAQEPALISGSILDNLRLARPEAKEEEINEVLTLCLLNDWIKGLPAGVHTHIHEAGVGVSGGEKQRIALAQTLLRQTDVLVLDEAASALDPHTAKTIFNNLVSLSWQPAIINITHRHSQITLFDKVVEVC